MRFGLIARADDRGLGNQTWEIARHYDPERVLVVRVRGSEAQGFAAHLDRYPGATVAVVDERNWTLPEAVVREWLDGLDVVYSAETLYDWRIAEWAREQRVATVVHANPEFFAHHRSDHPEPDAWWLPTRWRREHMPPDAVVVPMPVPVDRFAPCDPDRIERRVLHVAGRAATADRNGTRSVLRAARHLPSDIELVVTTQTPIRVPGGARVTVLDNVDDYTTLYDGFPLLVLPRRYGGLCLPASEACAAGAVPLMPAVVPNEHWPILPIRSTPSPQVALPAGRVDAVDTTPRDVAAAILEAFDSDLPLHRRNALQWASEHSYESLRDRWMSELAIAAENARKPRKARPEPTVTVVVPFTPGIDEHRDNAWSWIRRHYEAHHPDWTIVECTTDGPWSKARALAPAMENITTDVVIVADADCIIAPEALRTAVKRVAAGVPWVVPHRHVCRLTPPDTQRVLMGDPTENTPVSPRRLARRRYGGIEGGGVAVLTPQAWKTAPMDPRFEGWGYEDICWATALDTLVGEHDRLEVDLIHLWHNPQPNHGSPSPESQRLYGEYVAANKLPRRMAALVAGEPFDNLATLDEPVRFRASVAVLKVSGRRLHFRGGVLEVNDPDLADLLRQRDDVEEVA